MKHITVAWWLYALLAAVPAGGSDHVRIILDTSGTMSRNDRPRLATLATVLLFDLTRPKLTLGDSFEVLPFDPTVAPWTGGPPPPINPPRVVPTEGHRAQFVSAVTSLPYNAPHTYYYPMLRAALEDLERLGSSDDRRVIVFVTDGNPEDPDRSLVSRDLLPRLRAANIRVYLLAFGGAVNTQELHEVFQGCGQCEILTDPDGNGLLQRMIEIFTLSFGYTATSPINTTGSDPLDLEGHESPDRAVTVVYWRNPQTPQCAVQAPPGRVANFEGPMLTAGEAGASYALRWLLAPAAASHTLLAPPGATAIALRPSTLLVEVQPAQPNGQTHLAVAHVPLPLLVLVRPSGTGRGDPGQVALQHRVHGPREGSGFVWSGEPEPPQGPSRGTLEGREFQIAPIFPRDPEPSQGTYQGFLTLTARRGDAVIGALEGDQAHTVTVYPYLQLVPSPPLDNAAVGGHARALQRYESGCAAFRFVLQGSLPHPEQPYYSLKAVVDPAVQQDPRLYQAESRLDGVQVDLDGAPGPQPSDWTLGRRLSREELLASHEICVQLGKPRGTDLPTPVELPVRFTLLDSPYDQFATVQPFTLRGLVAPLSWIEKYAALVAIALGLLVGAIMWWSLRNCPDLAWGLRAATARAGVDPVPCPLGESPLLRRCLGMRSWQDLRADGGTYVLGRVRPLRQELYEVRPAYGIELHDAKGGPVEQLEVGRAYLAHTPRGDYHFRIEYA